jgi:hypothetical protein
VICRSGRCAWDTLDRSAFAARASGYAGTVDVEVVGGRRGQDLFGGPPATSQQQFNEPLQVDHAESSWRQQPNPCAPSTSLP